MAAHSGGVGGGEHALVHEQSAWGGVLVTHRRASHELRRQPDGVLDTVRYLRFLRSAEAAEGHGTSDTYQGAAGFALSRPHGEADGDFCVESIDVRHIMSGRVLSRPVPGMVPLEYERIFLALASRFSPTSGGCVALLCGLGAGTVASHLLAEVPSIKVVSCAERDPAVIAVARLLFALPDAVEVVERDALAYLQGASPGVASLVVVDVSEEGAPTSAQLAPPPETALPLVTAAWKALEPCGVLLVNVLSSAGVEAAMREAGRLGAALPGAALAAAVAGSGANVVLVAVAAGGAAGERDVSAASLAAGLPPGVFPPLAPLRVRRIA